MNLNYLIHLAKKGEINIHPGGWKATLALLEALDLHAGDCVLEIGCGTGGTMVQMLGNFPVKIYGIEILPEMLVVAKERLHFAGVLNDAHLVQSNGAALPFPGQKFDRVYAESVIGFQDAQVIPKILAEIHRVLKSKGLFVANEAVWKAQVDPLVVAEINRSCEADFGLRQATDQVWDIDKWREVILASSFHVHSVNLLRDHLRGMRLLESKMLSRKQLTSSLLTYFHRLSSYLNPRLVTQHLSYRKRLRNHREDSRFVEERLFILQKI